MNKYLSSLLLMIGVFNCTYIIGMEDGLSYNPEEAIENYIPTEVWEPILTRATDLWVKNTLQLIFEENIESRPQKIGTLIREHFAWVENKASCHIIYFLKKLENIHPFIKFIVNDSRFIQAYKAHFYSLLRQYLADYKFYNAIKERIEIDAENKKLSDLKALLETYSDEDCYNTFKLLSNFTDIYKQKLIEDDPSLVIKFLKFFRDCDPSLQRLVMLILLIKDPQLDINTCWQIIVPIFQGKVIDILTLKFMLIHPQININMNVNGDTPLHTAIEFSAQGFQLIETINLLLSDPSTDIRCQGFKEITVLELVEKKLKKIQAKFEQNPSSSQKKHPIKKCLEEIKSSLLQRQAADEIIAKTSSSTLTYKPEIRDGDYYERIFPHAHYCFKIILSLNDNNSCMY